MIKINLLGVAAPPPKVTTAAAPASKVLQAGSFVGAVVLFFGLVGLIYMIWSASIDALNLELRKQQVEQARLTAIKVENTKYDMERRLLEQRINTIQVLQANRVGPTEFMNALGDVVNRTSSDLFLFSVAPSSDRLVVRGQAATVNSVASLLSTMKTSGYFEDVQLRQFYEDDVENRLSYKFNLDCTYKGPAPAAATPPAGAAAGAPTPARGPRL